MKAEDFEQIWLDQVQAEKSMLLERASSYATDGDRLGNFYSGAKLVKKTEMQYAYGLVAKHILALRDFIETDAVSSYKITDRELAKITEYVTDIRNYAVLIKAIYMEKKEAQ